MDLDVEWSHNGDIFIFMEEIRSVFHKVNCFTVPLVHIQEEPYYLLSYYLTIIPYYRYSKMYFVGFYHDFKLTFFCLFFL